METRSNQVFVGSVVLVLVVLAALFTVWLSGLQGGDTKKYDIFFKQSVEGLATGSAVTFSGVPSGQIESIELWRADPDFKRVRIEVRDETPILLGTTATISAVGFTGVSQITLDGAVKNAPPITDVGPAGAPVIPARAGGFGAILNAAPQLLERVSTLTERLTELLSDQNQGSIAGILQNTERLSNALADRGPEIAATLADTRVAIRQAGDAAEKIGNFTASTSGKIDPVIRDLQVTVRSADRSLRTLETTLAEAQPGVTTFSKQTLPEVGQLVRDLRVVTESFGAVAGRLESGGATSLLGSPRLPDYEPRGERK